MASASASRDVEEEVKCPICMECLIGPVTLECGHNFCKDCISQYCEKWEDMIEAQECPLCKARIKKGNFRPNWQLANIAEKIKCLGKEHLCVKHKEKLNLFCKEDQELVCLICERSPEHRSHTVLLLEEAAKECKEQLCTHMKVLPKEREILLESKAVTEKESQDLLGEIEEKKSRTLALFNQLHQFLEEHKTIFLSQLEELKKEMANKREEYMAGLMKELSSLESLIHQMEEKCRQPASELLQDIRRTLERYEKKEAFENWMVFPPELTCRIRGVYDAKPLLEGLMNQLTVSAANVTLNPDTAHPRLSLSKDLKSVTWSDKWEDLPYNSERFGFWPYVLGSEGFTAGRHFWEVIVENKGEWAVGVARESVRRKSVFELSPEEGIWIVSNWKSLSFLLEKCRVYPLSLCQKLKKIRVFLNCAEREVSFSDADTGVPIYTHSGLSFSGEMLFPFFFLSGKVHLRLSP